MTLRSLVIFVFSIANLCVSVRAASNVVLCYYDSSATSRPGSGQVTPEDLDPNLCTHMTYAFFGINTKAEVTNLNYTNDITLGNLRKFLDLKAINRNVKMIASIGGRDVSSAVFSYVMKSPNLREYLVTNITSFCASNGFDGVNIQWEYPGVNGGAEVDKSNFVLFLKRLKEAMLSKIVVITAGAKADMMTISYDIPRVSLYVDLISLETCHYHSVTETRTGQNSPLYTSKIDKDTTLSVNATIMNWISRGAPRSKLTLGIAAFGLSFSLKNASQTYLGAPANGAGVPGPFLQTPGRMMYTEICRRFINLPTWTVLFSERQQNPYAYKGFQWIGYDNPHSVGLKTEYAIRQNLAGVSLWALDYDDITGYCGDGVFPMLNAAYQTIFP